MHGMCGKECSPNKKNKHSDILAINCSYKAGSNCSNCFKEVVEAFGYDIVGDDGEINRKVRVV